MIREVYISRKKCFYKDMIKRNYLRMNDRDGNNFNVEKFRIASVRKFRLINDILMATKYRDCKN